METNLINLKIYWHSQIGFFNDNLQLLYKNFSVPDYSTLKLPVTYYSNQD